MTFLFYLFVAISVALLVALIAARRKIAMSAPRPKFRPDSAAGAARLAAAADLAPVGIVVLNGTGGKVFENQAAASYTAATADDAIVGLRLRNLLEEAAGYDESIEQEIELYSPSPRTILLRAVPLFEQSDRIGTVAFIEDLTTTSHIDSIRSDFIANASHELKTPLGAMRLLADALLATGKPEVVQDLAQRIQGEAGRMSRLVEDILDLALIEEARATEKIPVDLCDIVGDAIDQSTLLAETAGIPVHPTYQPAMVAGDRRPLVSAVANLVENAINYTSAKGVDDPAPVEIRVSREGQVAAIEVEDRGIGIPERHQDRIFERFYRVDRGRSRASGGTGLGLAIVRHVVQNHHGKISVRSIPGEGSTFRVELPAVED